MGTTQEIVKNRAYDTVEGDEIAEITTYSATDGETENIAVYVTAAVAGGAFGTITTSVRGGSAASPQGEPLTSVSGGEVRHEPHWCARDRDWERDLQPGLHLVAETQGTSPPDTRLPSTRRVDLA